MKRFNVSRKLVFSVSFVLAAIMGLAIHYLAVPPSATLTQEQVAEGLPEDIPIEQAYPHEILPKTSLYIKLRELDIPPVVISQIVIAAKPIADLGNLKSGTRFQLSFSKKMKAREKAEELSGIKFRFSPVEKLEIKRAGEIWKAEKISIPVETRVVNFQGVVESSLWASAESANMDPNLIADLAEIFAWQVDFAREVQQKDRWRLSVEQKLVNGKPYAWGAIQAAEYQNGEELHQAILYQVSETERGYFAPDGSSLRRMFLKSPMRYGRISSRFNKARFHPVLKVRRPHLGVDYAAPTGTPIRAVGGGVVTFAAWRGGGGRTIQIRHNSTYKTAYKHLSRFAKGIRSGARVQQGQIIGYVGSSGLSTGPHLHFEFFQNGRFVDPLGRKFPTADPVPNSLLSQFKSQAPQILAALPSWGDRQISSREEQEAL